MDSLAVAFFAFLGGDLRFFLSSIIPNQHFPIATVLINLTGSFLLAFITTYIAERWPLPHWLVVGMSTGFVGAFTTFSGFSLEELTLLTRHQLGLGVIYLLTSLIGGFLLASFGMALGRKLLN
ncbi:fluoride efflux transporter FluC [Loigolactobacillus backii]|uniref:Fluoride-specific ion channel FluC n=1 Tax=Loigolactobacillus backii TaxID=375175 RepID=A0A192H049_9LACO|nr:CrcB family protein [Loigolactobacillus backii]ANK60398.1 hypothetical protein AYR52_09130 [Loigolactobacillus backii]ANK62164.1 hypothetical protein AYR53_04875 [Loigolactobacillus backii]ANK65277.1 hypothetical protein AYR54_08535 [Loigolactobacillus backii]ANK67837.1 hypothetical protein AYR55_09140 [Loigolactobacillus backii]ANK70822.1 hypothetical protein AYR56_12110 [Loigolactobacillus backii]